MDFLDLRVLRGVGIDINCAKLVLVDIILSKHTDNISISATICVITNL